MTGDMKSELKDILRKSCESTELGKTTAAFAKAHEAFVECLLDSPTEATGLYYSMAGFAMVGDEGNIANIPLGDEKWFTAAALLVYPLTCFHSHHHGITLSPRAGYRPQVSLSPL